MSSTLTDQHCERKLNLQTDTEASPELPAQVNPWLGEKSKSGVASIPKIESWDTESNPSAP